MKLFTDTLQLDSKDFVFSSSNQVLALSWFRLILIVAMFSGSVLIQILQGDFLGPSIWQPLNIFFTIALIAQFALIEWYDKISTDKRLTFFIFCLDILLIALISAMWGVFHSFFLFVALVNVALGSFICGLNDGIKLGFWSVFTINLAFALSPYFNPEDLSVTFLINNISILVTSGLSAHLGEQVSHISSDIESKAATIEQLKNINELIVDNIPSGLMVVSDQFRIEKANRGAIKIFSDLSLEKRALQEVSPEIFAEIQTYQGQYKKNSFHRAELEVGNFKGERLVLETIISTFRSSGEEREQFLCLIQNVTEVRNLELAMQQKEKLAAVGQLAAGIAHEIRNPLASISGSVQLLQANLATTSPEDKKLLAIVVREIDRLNNLITEFLDYVRPEVRVDDAININSLVADVLEVVKLNDKLAKNVVQRKELRAQGIIFGHADKLKQALLNIVINSYQAMGDTLRPEIYVHSYDAENQIVLVIQDNGMGMTKETLRRVFEPFHTTKPGGTGLGLAITHKILETHKATVRIDSELGQGTKFSIVFPAGFEPDENRIYLKKQA